MKPTQEYLASLPKDEILEHLALLSDESLVALKNKDYDSHAEVSEEILSLNIQLYSRMFMDMRITKEHLNHSLKIIIQNAIWSGNIEAISLAFKLRGITDKKEIGKFMVLNGF